MQKRFRSGLPRQGLRPGEPAHALSRTLNRSNTPSDVQGPEEPARPLRLQRPRHLVLLWPKTQGVTACVALSHAQRRARRPWPPARGILTQRWSMAVGKAVTGIPVFMGNPVYNLDNSWISSTAPPPGSSFPGTISPTRYRSHHETGLSVPSGGSGGDAGCDHIPRRRASSVKAVLFELRCSPTRGSTLPDPVPLRTEELGGLLRRHAGLSITWSSSEARRRSGPVHEDRPGMEVALL